MDFTKVSPNFH